MARSKNFPPKPPVSNSCKKNIFTVDNHGCDTSASDDGDNLLVYPLQIDDLAEHAAWSNLTTSNGYIICKLDTGVEARILLTTAFNKFHVGPPLQPTNM